MNKSFIMTMFLGFFLIMNTSAEDRRPAMSANITLHLVDDHVEEMPLTLVVIDDFLWSNVGAKEQQCIADAQNNYTFKIKNIRNRVNFHLQYGTFRFLSGVIDPGDDIKIIYTRKVKYPSTSSLRFSGRGSTKLSIAWKSTLSVANLIIAIPKSKAYTRSGTDSLLKMADSIYRIRKTELVQYRSKLDEDAFARIDAHLFGKIYESIIGYFDLAERKNISDENLKYYLEEFNKLGTNFSEQAACQSMLYMDYQYKRYCAWSRLHCDDPKQRFMTTFNEIATHKNILVREKLLLYFLLIGSGYQKSADPELVYDKSLQHINKQSYRNVIEAIRIQRRMGTPAFNFSLVDANGKTVKLSDFRNKVVVIDCWFKSCSSCSALAQQIGKQVIPRFKDRNDLIFLSINVDRSKETWFEALKLEEYSHPGVIHLYTQGLGVNHPFMVNYNFKAFPQLLLIDASGKMISTNIRGTADEIANKITAALKATN